MLGRVFNAIASKFGYTSKAGLSNILDAHTKEVAELYQSFYSQGMLIEVLREKEATLFYLSDMFHNKKGRDAFSSGELNKMFTEARLHTSQYGGIRSSTDMNNLNAFNDYLSTEAWKKVCGQTAESFLPTEIGMRTHWKNQFSDWAKEGEYYVCNF